ncbi:MAG: hypothetical protein HZA91_01000 [Verrucomicrobia bacterium]|nr:hypothetical protein [Verrucomicrobiota bacterium]
MRRLLVLMLVSLLPAVAGAAQVSVRLIHATSAAPAKPDTDLAADAPRLQKAFGYSDYKVLSRQNATMGEGEIRQFELLQKFSLRLKLLRASAAGYFMRCEMLHGDKNLMETTVTIASGSSYFITGPEYDKGQLLIAVAVK